jgi:hypothetical protein
VPELAARNVPDKDAKRLTKTKDVRMEIPQKGIAQHLTTAS